MRSGLSGDRETGALQRANESRPADGGHLNTHLVGWLSGDADDFEPGSVGVGFRDFESSLTAILKRKPNGILSHAKRVRPVRSERVNLRKCRHNDSDGVFVGFEQNCVPKRVGHMGSLRR